MRLRIAGVATSTSVATARPLPSVVRASVWQTTPCKVPASCTVNGILVKQLISKEKLDAIVTRTAGGGGEIVKLMGTSAYYAPAYAGKAFAWSWLADLVYPPREAEPKGKAAALKALELDPSNVEARSILAAIIGFYDWDFAAAEKESRESNAEREPDEKLPRTLAHHHFEDTGRIRA